MLPEPNCCKRPHLHAIKIVAESEDIQKAIFRCDACDTYWGTAVNAWAIMERTSDEFGGSERLSTDQAVNELRPSR